MATAQLTVHGTIIGTPDYMSPEQVKGVALDSRSDLFSLGVILAEMVSGQHPFRQPSMAETLAAVLREPPDLSADIPHGLTALIGRLLAKNPEDRCASAAEVRADLAALAGAREEGAHQKARAGGGIDWRSTAGGGRSRDCSASEWRRRWYWRGSDSCSRVLACRLWRLRPA